MINLPIILTIIASIFSLMITLVVCTWVISNRFAKIEVGIAAELAAIREILLAHNKRMERLESKIP